MWWLSLVLVLLPTPVWADVTVIYRASDQVVCGWVTPPQSVAVEQQNCAVSELGGVAADYATATVTTAQWATRGDKDVTINPGGHVVFVPNAVAEQRKVDRAAGRAHLKAGSPLTEAELQALGLSP